MLVGLVELVMQAHASNTYDAGHASNTCDAGHASNASNASNAGRAKRAGARPGDLARERGWRGYY